MHQACVQRQTGHARHIPVCRQIGRPARRAESIMAVVVGALGAGQLGLQVRDAAQYAQTGAHGTKGIPLHTAIALLAIELEGIGRRIDGGRRLLDLEQRQRIRPACAAPLHARLHLLGFVGSECLACIGIGGTHLETGAQPLDVVGVEGQILAPGLGHQAQHGSDGALVVALHLLIHALVACAQRQQQPVLQQAQGIGHGETANHIVVFLAHGIARACQNRQHRVVDIGGVVAADHDGQRAPALLLQLVEREHQLMAHIAGLEAPAQTRVQRRAVGIALQVVGLAHGGAVAHGIEHHTRARGLASIVMPGLAQNAVELPAVAELEAAAQRHRLVLHFGVDAAEQIVAGIRRRNQILHLAKAHHHRTAVVQVHLVVIGIQPQREAIALIVERHCAQTAAALLVVNLGLPAGQRAVKAYAQAALGAEAPRYIHMLLQLRA